MADSGDPNTKTRSHKTVASDHEGKQRRDFMRALLTDLRSFKRMLAENRFESGVRRIGAEQELFLINEHLAPANGVVPLLAKLDDSHYTTELGQFQLEANADPQPFGGDGIARLEAQLNQLVNKANAAAATLDMKTILAGILPTMRTSDLGLDSMVPSPRYLALNQAMHEIRGGASYEFSIKGLDELIIKHDSVMVEACNSSFQVHLQVDADEFPRLYNLAQVLAAPLIAIAANSPLLFGRRLWAETRIALFRQAVDTRTHSHHLRDREARVSFGTKWVKDSVAEIFQEDIARFRTLVGTDLDEDPIAVLDAGGVPALKALRLHNGTIYRWNRACYGVMNGKPHLRIENRVMPSGPSVVDEVANGAFWFGLMVEMGARGDDVSKQIEFDQAGANFYTAAREGLGAHFTWLDGKDISATNLVLDKLLPIAEAGLRRQKIDDADVKRYLGVVDARVRTGQTGARWAMSSWNALKEAPAGARANSLVAATLDRQLSGKPVSEWSRARLGEVENPRHNYVKVEQFMTTDLVTVHAEDPIEMVANLMSWERIRHIPVEDKEHRLVGLITYREVLKFFTSGGSAKDTAVSEIMQTDVATVSLATPTQEALHLMRRLGVGCLPVVDEGKLVGILTDEDFMKIATKILDPNDAGGGK